ncbi:hypothetical protein [Nonomuraea glycinis]|uniref:hypothetical protein n=1 Tax=Nonomuraea glycinis TaxID=2047744 RepID=UPI0033BB7C42
MAHEEVVGHSVHAADVQAAAPGVAIRPMRESDADQVLAIYQAGLDNAPGVRVPRGGRP